MHMIGEVTKNTTEGLTLIIRAVRIADEVKEHLLLLEHDLFNTKTLAKYTKGDNADQFLGHLRNLAKTVAQTGTIGFKGHIEVMAIGKVVEFTVKQHPFRVIRHILFREEHLNVGLQGTVIDKKEVRGER